MLPPDGATNQVRNTAAREGWLPPIAWDDEDPLTNDPTGTIDDPDARPNLGDPTDQAEIDWEATLAGRLPTGRAKQKIALREAAVMFFTAQGLSAPDIANLLGVTARTVHRDRTAAENAGCPVNGRLDPSQINVNLGLISPSKRHAKRLAAERRRSKSASTPADAPHGEAA